MESTRYPDLNGLHHVTAITRNAQKNLDFYTKSLGLRLVKQTVNQDDTTAYHLFYADANGSAGTDMTFFEWPYVRRAHHGAGGVVETGFRVLGGTEGLETWVKHFDALGISHGPIETTWGLPSLAFWDEEGQPLRLIAEADQKADLFHPWIGSPVGLENAIVGLSNVKIQVPNAAETIQFLTQVMGFRPVEGNEGWFEVGLGGAGHRIHVMQGTDGARDGAGGVHHVAWRVEKGSDILAWKAHLRAHGYASSGPIDRHYFESLYFRIPGGILFEIATAGPGFDADGEAAEHLGETLALPPFLEPHREHIVARLTPLQYEPANRSQP